MTDHAMTPKVLDESIETLKWLNYIGRCGLATPESLAGLIKEGSELVSIFRASHRTARGGQRRRPSRRPNRQDDAENRGNSGD